MKPKSNYWHIKGNKQLETEDAEEKEEDKTKSMREKWIKMADKVFKEKKEGEE